MPTAERRNQEAAAEAAGRGEHRFARSHAVEPGAGRRRRDPEHHDRDAENPAELASASNHPGADLVMPISLVIGRLKTLNA